MPVTFRSRKPRRGLALVTVLLITTVFLILIGALMSNVVSELKLTGLHGNSNEAQRAAYAGIDEMVYQFELNDAGAAPGATPAPQSNSYTDDDGNTASYSVTVDTTQWQSQLPYYIIHSTGNAGGAQRKVDALIEKQPFSAFNMFTISEFTNVGGTVFYASGEQFNGPVYSGGPMRVAYTDGKPPIFNDEVINAGTTTWVPGAPANSTDWAAVIANQANWHQVTSPLTLPTTNDNTQVEYAALTGNPAPSPKPAIPGTAGLYINGANVTAGGSGSITSGLFIAGTVTITSVGSVASNTETLTLAMSGVTETVKIDLNAKTTIVQNSSGKTIASYSGVPVGEQAPGVVGSNGAIFSTGAMTINAGSTFRGQYTLGVPDGQGLPNPTITMKGTVEYADTSLTSTDELAYWANDIVLTDNVNGNIEIDGAMFTGYYGECSTVCNDGTFKNSNCSVAPTCGGGTGVLTMRGSLIENVRGKRGTLGSTVSGFSTNGVYDPRLATKPPPFTPTTTQYVILALCTEDSTGATCGQ
ncbi:MAG: hypothetical protein JO219_05815 [Candidatus Eremiobacteraeota bacterium]|nr:hypothetical protein [Candidatus Eremiobacteraeota bacterium]